jgi:hypothetical protein
MIHTIDKTSNKVKSAAIVATNTGNPRPWPGFLPKRPLTKAPDQQETTLEPSKEPSTPSTPNPESPKSTI